MDFTAGLNPQQQQAVAHVHGPLLILAGAGSGKTRVVTHRISHLIAAHRVSPERILAVTFTNKAAAEMRDRISSLLGDSLVPGRRPDVSTFHSFCVRLLRRDGAPLAQFRPSFTRQFLIYDDDDQLTLLKSLYKQHAIDDKALPPRSVLSAISTGKNRGETPEDWLKSARDDKSKWMAKLYEQYNDGLVRANALDFDDLLLESVRLLKSDAPTREKFGRWLEFLMVDEYQDTNRAQYELIRLLSTGHDNVCVVGDEDQSIYSWRGADIQNILDFERDFPNALVIRLEQNYRSTKTILEAASSVIANNKQRKGKWLWTESESGPKVTVYTAHDSENEALFIADTVDKIFRRDAKARAAVLYRTNSQSRQIEEALRRYRLNYVVVGGLSFYQRAEIKDVLAYLKMLMVPGDGVSLHRIINTPARGIGKTTLEQIEQYGRDHGLSPWHALVEMLDTGVLSGRAEAAVAGFRRLVDHLRDKVNTARLHELIHEMLELTGYRRMLKEDKTPGAESRIENLDELLNAAADAAERGETIAEFLDHAALVADADQVDEKARLSLLTVHNAKGLEFPVVFLAGMEERLFPHARSLDSESMMEEERRLCYVGMTRAEQQLFITHALSRRRYGGTPPEPAVPSRFIAELPPELCQLEGVRRDPLEDAGFETPGEIDLFAERGFVRESARWPAGGYSKPASPPQPRASSAPPWSTGTSVSPKPRPAGSGSPSPQGPSQSTGSTAYNSKENISRFFRERGIPARGFNESPSTPAKRPDQAPARPPATKPVVQTAARQVSKKTGGAGSTVVHPKYGRGTIVRKEGDGDDAKLTVMFPGHGLKKLIAKYAGLQ
ncbi:MAG: UvrD-helicase domain-containing protein [Bryobacteraceae bacterium]